MTKQAVEKRTEGALIDAQTRAPLDMGLNLPAGCVSYRDLAGTNRPSLAGKNARR
jgi:hypothetical protein